MPGSVIKYQVLIELTIFIEIKKIGYSSSFFVMALVLVWVLVHESMSISFGHLFMMPGYL